MSRRVCIKLIANVRLEYEEVVEVPDDFTDADLDALVEQRSEDVESDDYSQDHEFWEQGPSFHSPEKSEPALQRVSRNSDGSFELIKS